MAFVDGLAASPDPSNDYVFDSQEFTPHDRLLQDARRDAQHFIDAVETSEGESKSQADLASFDYSRRELSSLPTELVDIIKDHVARLALGYNMLNTLSGIGPRMGDFKKLTYLVLRNCDFRDFPREILACTTLETLDFHGNAIRHLPDDLSKLRNLKKFAIDRNKLVRVPTCVSKMTSLQQFILMNNPIEFPEKSLWKVQHGYHSSNDSNYKMDGGHVVEETKRLKRALLQSEKTERSPESEHGESTNDAPKPLRKKFTGRFPVRPSLSSVDIEAASSVPASPVLSARPLLKSSKTTMVPQLHRQNSTRPGIEPLVSPERYRSNSESHMVTSRRQKRMGVHVSKGGNSSGEMSLEGSLDITNDPSNHARGPSNGSLLQHFMQTNPVVDPCAVESPHPSDISRSASFYDAQSRLSSLPENKRKSQYNRPDVQIAETILYTVEQVEAPIKKLVKATKPAGLKRRSLDRSCFAAFANKDDLARTLKSLESYDEDDGGKRRSSFDLHEYCERSMSSFQQLLDVMQSHISTILEHSQSRDLRMVMLTAVAGIVEIRELWTRLADGMVLPDDDDYRSEELEARQQLTVRLPSPVSRPTTSLRVRDPSRLTTHHHKNSSVAKRLPSPQTMRSASGTSLLSRMPSYASTFSKMLDGAPPTPALPNTNSFVSNASNELSEDEDEDRAFEAIHKALSHACYVCMDRESLRLCQKTFIKLRDRQRGSIYGFDAIYEEILRTCEYAMSTCDELRARINPVKVKDSQARNRAEFWQVCTGFTKAFAVFATTVKESQSRVQIPEEIKKVLRPVHSSVKSVSSLIEKSPWRNFAVHGPNSAGLSPAGYGHLPFSMSNSNPPPVPPPVRDLPARPTNQLSNGSGLGLQPSLSSSTSLASSSTMTNNTGTIRALPSSYARENGSSSATPTPGKISRASSRAGYSSSTMSRPTINTSYASYFSDSTPTDLSLPNSARPAASDDRNGAHSYSDSRHDPRYTPSLPELSPGGAGADPRSAHSSGYSTPLPPTPMTAALGPAAQATISTESNTGTVKKITTNLDHNYHSQQNSLDNAFTNGNSGISSNSYFGGPSNWDIGPGPGTAVSARAVNGSKPNPIERSVSAAGYYPNGVPQRLASRNVSRSASQRR